MDSFVTKGMYGSCLSDAFSLLFCSIIYQLRQYVQTAEAKMGIRNDKEDMVILLFFKGRRDEKEIMCALYMNPDVLKYEHLF
jgi:hypothetical protein